MDRVDRSLEVINKSVESIVQLKEKYEGKKKGQIYHETLTHHTKKIRHHKRILHHLFAAPVKKYVGVLRDENGLEKKFEYISVGLSNEEFIKLVQYHTGMTLVRMTVKQLKEGNLKFKS